MQPVAHRFFDHLVVAVLLLMREKEEAARRATRKARIKERVGNVRPIRGLYGVWCAFRGGDYLMQKQTSSAVTVTDDAHQEKQQQQQQE